MTLSELCEKIGLQEELSSDVLTFAASFDFSAVADLLERYKTSPAFNDITAELQNRLGDDPRGVKILACFLWQAVRVKAWYDEERIGEDVYIATFRWFTRFIDETRQKTGRVIFRPWWTGRQIGLHMFRLGELEYEFMFACDEPFVNVHIPSGADLSEEPLKQSFAMAKAFINDHFPAYRDKEIRCTSWLLCDELLPALSPSSKIRVFRSFFDLTPTGSRSTGFVGWLYMTDNITDHFEDLPENTLLRRYMKQQLLQGHVPETLRGVLKGAYR